MDKSFSMKIIYPYSEKIDFALCDGLMILARKGQTNQKKSTMSFESDKRFNDFKHFPRGLRRSGEFTVAEADSLEKYGTAMLALYQGNLAPRDDVESAFIEQVKSGAAGSNPHAKVWFKYLKVIGPKRVHRLCTVAGGANEETGGGGFDGGNGGGSDESID
uniref:Macrodomain Ori protein n=5 Tax=Bacteria TaxID=2 RepID=A0A3L0VVB3_ECOLX